MFNTTARNNKYVEFVRGLAKPGHQIQYSLTPQKAHLIHMALLATGEAGELADAIKKHTIYGKKLDIDNVLEEAGDLLFALVGILDSLGLSLEDAIEHNTGKLKSRYATGSYSDKQAVERADKKDKIVYPANPLVDVKVDNTSKKPWPNVKVDCARLGDFVSEECAIEALTASAGGVGSYRSTPAFSRPSLKDFNIGNSAQTPTKKCCSGHCESTPTDEEAVNWIRETLGDLGFSVIVKK